LAGDGGRVGGDLRRRALRHDLAAMDARAGADVEDVIGLADRLLVMFDDDHRVALVAQVLQRREQPVIVALVQADGGLVEHVEDAGEARSDLGGQPDALASPPDSVPALRLSVRYSRPTLLRNPSRSRISFRMARAISFFCWLRLGGHAFAPGIGLADRHLHDLAHMQVRDLHRQRLFPQAVAAAGAAGAVVLVALEFLADPGAIGLAVAALHVGDHALEVRFTW
jgi:hypothetical protein